MSDIFEIITEYACEHYYEKYAFNNEELSDIRDEILKLQDQYSDMGLTDVQKDVINNLMRLHTELCEECVEKVYTQGLKDCVTILKELGII